MLTLRRSLAILVGFCGLWMPSLASARDLSFEERVQAQEAIERVSYAHQIGATRPFEQAIPRAVLESKVRTYLEQSAALEAYWKTPVTAEALDRELERMIRETRMPDRLREIFAALGNDRRLILECLARPALVDRLSRGFFAFDQSIHAQERGDAEVLRRRLVEKDLSVRADHPLRRVVEFVLAGERPLYEPAASERGLSGRNPSGPRHVDLAAADFARARKRAPEKVHEIGGVVEGSDAFVISVVLDESESAFTVATWAVPKITWDEWWSRVAPGLAGASVTAIDLADLPPGTESLPLVSRRVNATADCQPGDTWQSTNPPGLPDPRIIHTAVWTGSVMIVWGGVDDLTAANPTYLNSGGRYDPATDTWEPTSTSNAPAARYDHTAVWTGSEMIVWGGYGDDGYLDSGGRYDPATDTWTATSAMNAPSARVLHTAVWTGARMIVWGGVVSGTSLDSGALYDPASDSWTATSSINAPSPRAGHAAVWSGSQMIVWGGVVLSGSVYLNTGSRYDPVTDTWSPTTMAGAPQGRERPDAVWTGTTMVIWGGNVTWPNFLRSGGQYDPVADAWTPVSTIGAPPARAGEAAVWTGSEMILFGGEISFLIAYDTIAWRYNPASDTWSSTAAPNAPLPRTLHTAVWTGSRMIVWGGEIAIYTGGEFYYYTTTNSNSGGRYDPATNSWTPTSSGGLPSERSSHTAVWTGSRMIVWGGYNGSIYYNSLGDGARYDPATSAWSPISMASAPSARAYHTAVWSGSRMIIWGGYGDSGDVSSGGLYDPIADSWSATSTAGAPAPADGHSAVWTGSRMIVWGGSSGNIKIATGGQYDPATDTWVATSMVNAPSARSQHTAIWTGSRMIVWGGSPYPYGAPLATGGLYDPATDTWASVSTVNAPSGRYLHTAVWTGARMVVWGGSDYFGYVNTGGLYDPGTDAWTPTSLAGAPDVRDLHTAVWTGTRMIVWGGESYSTSQLTQGGLYDPQADTWRLTSTTGAPAPRFAHTAVWTGTQMIVWGGEDGLHLNSGGVYTPEAGLAPPTADAGTDFVAECSSAGGTVVQLHGTGAGCGTLTYTWTGPFAEGGGTIQGSDVSVTLPFGASAITLTVTDAQGQQGTDGVLVTIQDTMPPALTLAADPSTLWPPNHRLVPVNIAILAQDLCDPGPMVALVSASSNEPDDAPGMHDGDTPGDIVGADLGSADTLVSLRAERDASGPGRSYRLTYQASDTHGNTRTSFVDVIVPHDLGSGPEPLLMSLSPDAAAGDAAAGMVRIDWPIIPGSIGYDLISGELSQAGVVNHTLNLGAVRLLAGGTTQTTFGEGATGALPVTGTALFYLLQSRTAAGGTGYGTESAPWPRVPDSCDAGCP